MSAHVLFNLSNELRKRDKNVRLAENFIFFHNDFNKFNNTGARMLDPINYRISKLNKIAFWA